MKILKQKVELVDLYHHQMEEFDNLKMEYAFMKVTLLIYWYKSIKNQAEQWALHKKQVSEIIWKAFGTYWKDEELYYNV